MCGRERLPLLERLHGERSEDEAADVGEERHTATPLRMRNRGAPVQELEAEPDEQEEGGGVAFFAHIGGFVFGAVTVKLLQQRQPLAPTY